MLEVTVPDNCQALSGLCLLTTVLILTLSVKVLVTRDWHLQGGATRHKESCQVSWALLQASKGAGPLSDPDVNCIPEALMPYSVPGVAMSQARCSAGGRLITGRNTKRLWLSGCSDDVRMALGAW